METENNSNEVLVEAQKSPLYCVTPLSKYLAMVLFILLPFIGGWVGYMNAPEKVVEVEKVVTKEIAQKEVVAEIKDQNKINFGQYGEFTLVSYEADTVCAYGGISAVDCLSERFNFVGTSTISGYIETEWMNSPYFVVMEKDIMKMPSRLNGLGLSPNVYTMMHLSGKEVSELYKDGENLSKDQVITATIELSDFTVGVGLSKGNSGMPQATIIRIVSTSTALRSAFPDPTSVSYYEKN